MRHLPQHIQDELAELSRLQKLLTSQRHNLVQLEFTSLSATAALAEVLMGIERAKHEIRWRSYRINRGDYDV
jgi:hypothetical protein